MNLSILRAMPQKFTDLPIHDEEYMFAHFVFSSSQFGETNPIPKPCK
jgi:hypothetical protein